MNKYINKVSEFRIIIIYGAGKIGRRTLQELKKLGVEDKIKYFAKSEIIFEPYEIEGIQVKSIYDLGEYYKNAIFLLAVGDKYIHELEKIAKLLKIKNRMDARKIYLDSHQRNDLVLKVRNKKIDYYKRKESNNNRKDSMEMCACHITYCFVSNTGDTVLSQCVRRFFNLKKWNIKNVCQEVNQKLIDEINESNVLIIGGGGLFLPDTNENSISGWQWAASKEQIEKIKVPIIIFSVGYNYFKGQSNSELFISSLNHIVAKAAFVGLRNRGSVKAVRDLVDSKWKSKIVYQPCTTTLIRRLYRVEPKRGSKMVVFNVAFDREERRYGENKDVILSQVAKAAALIEERGYVIIYVAHCDDDLKFLPYLKEAGVNYKVKNLTQCFPDEVIRFYRKTEVVIGMRGHAQMIPFGIGIKIISLGTHDKMRWFLEDVNMEDCYVDLNKDFYMITSKVVDIFVNIVIKYPAETDVRLKREQDKLLEISCKNRAQIIDFICKGE